MHFWSLSTFLAFISLVFFSTHNVNAAHTYRRAPNRCRVAEQRPNILFFLVDELRKPVIYESEDLKGWVRENLKTMTFLQDNGVNFDYHYCGATACAPSRTTLFTGQYPTLHGVSQTDGAAKTSADPTMFWLSPYCVPTVGNIFLEGGYSTYYVGKWHISKDDLCTPGTQEQVLSYHKITGVPDMHLMNVYKSANMLSPYGFQNGWIGPEAHGNSPHQSGSSSAIGVSGRDVFFADETIALLRKLEKENITTSPWFIVCSFVNPHDIALYGEISKNADNFNFTVDPTLPSIAPSPTTGEDLSTKPLAQASYQLQYQNVFQLTLDTEHYRQLYYTLQKKVDEQMGRVLEAFLGSSFRNNTIIVFTSDHGDLLGSHSNFQKWFNIYEEVIHVPLTFYSPTLLPKGKRVDLLTSHVDIIPTLCGLAKIDYKAITHRLQSKYTNARPLVGRDLSSIVFGKASLDELNALEEPILFLTYDQIFTGASSDNKAGVINEYVIQPAFIDAVITRLQGQGDGIWKLAKYFQNDKFSEPMPCACSAPIEKATIPIQFEMYDLENDPFEMTNLADPMYSTPEMELVQTRLLQILHDQLEQKALEPFKFEVLGQ